MPDEDKRGLTEAKKRANAKFKASAYDRIELNVPKGEKDIIKAHAAEFQPEQGEIGKPGYTPKGSITGFIRRAVNETMERDKAASDDPANK